jgi:hypothetical protein
MSKPVLKSGREDVRALDGVYAALQPITRCGAIRVLRFYCASQDLKWSDLFPEAKS